MQKPLNRSPLLPPLPSHTTTPLQLTLNRKLTHISLNSPRPITIQIDKSLPIINLHHATLRILDHAQDIAANGVDVLDGCGRNATVLDECGLREESGELVGSAVDDDAADGGGAAEVVGQVDGEVVLLVGGGGGGGEC